MTLQAELPTILPAESTRLRRTLIYFGLLYFSQGVTQIVALIDLPLRTYLTSRQLDTTQVASFYFVAMIPWTIKPLYGLVSDFFPLFGYRRKTYLLLVNCLAALAFLSVTGIRDPKLLLIAMFMTGIGVAASDVIVDALMVEAGQESGKTRLFQGVQWACLMSALLLSSFASYFILKHSASPLIALRTAALVAMCLPLLVAGLTWFLVFDRRMPADVEGFKATGRSLLHALTSWRLWFVLLFLCLVNFRPGAVTPLIDFLREKRGIGPADQALLRTWYAVGGAMGAVLFTLLLSERLSIRWTVVIGVVVSAAGLLPLGFVHSINQARFIYFGYGASWTIGTLSLLSLAAEACPKRAEAFVFATLMAIMNLAVQAADPLGSYLYENVLEREVRWLIVLSTGITLSGLLLAPFLPDRQPDAPA